MGGIIHGERCGVVLSRALLPMSGTIASRPTDDRSAVPPFLSRSFAPNLSTSVGTEKSEKFEKFEKFEKCEKFEKSEKCEKSKARKVT